MTIGWTYDGWQLGPQNRWTFQHLREIVPTARVARAADPRPLPAAEQIPLDVPLARADGTTAPLETLLRELYVDGLLVLADGEVRLETYPTGMPADRTHLLMSVSKSLVGCVAGVLVDRGDLDPDARVEAYLPEVAAGGYAGATVRDVLDMRSGIAFNEDYLDPQADVKQFEKAVGWAPYDGTGPASLYEYLALLPAARDHGGRFEYRSCETDLLGWVCERAAGTRMPILLSEVLWAPLGTEQDMDASVDRAGAVLHDGGFATTLRDLARFGALVADGGRVDDRQVVPGWWIDDATTGGADSRAAFAASGDTRMPGGMYRSQFWVPYPARDVLMCLGINGQMVYVDRPRRLVVVKLSSTPLPLHPEIYRDTLALIDQLPALLA